jgi:hypothetical protein
MFHAGKQGTDDARAAVLASAPTFGDILNIVPVAYRESLRRPLRELSELAGKAVSVSHACDNLNRHKAAGTWPPALQGIHLPKIEVTAGYLATSPPILTHMKTEHEAYRTLALDRAVELKNAEMLWLRGQLDPQVYLLPLGDILNARWHEVEKMVRRPVFGRNADGQTTLDSFIESPTARAEYDRLVTDLPAICGRLILLEDTRYMSERNKRDEKHKLKADADVEMGEITTSGTAIADIVDKKVSAALKKLSIKVSSDIADDIATFTNPLSLGKRIWSETQSQENRKKRRLEGEGDSYGSSSQTTPSAREKERPYAEAEREEEEVQASAQVIAALRFEYGKPNTYPDELLLIPRPLAIRLLLRTASLEEIEASRFRGGVHLGPGVTAPMFICIHLSSGARYLPRVVPHVNKITSSYDDFCDRLRWRLYWLQKELSSDTEKKPYEPDYEIPHERNVCSFKIPYVERGLEQGRAYIDNFIANVEPSLQRRNRVKPDLVDVKTTLKFLSENDYLVLGTDKNLGQCIVTRQWFITETAKLVADPESYMELDLPTLNETLESQRVKINTLADNAFNFLGHEQLSKFLRHLVPVQPTDGSVPKYTLPRFYGIPKIHKNPTRMRPIVPCHQAMQNPAAKYVSKVLKPVIEKLPYVIKGTKDMAMKLDKLQIVPNRRFFLVGFDLVAFYTNVDVDYCIKACQQYYKEVCKPSLQEQVIFLQAINLSFKTLLFEFNGKFYRQRKGIAMGVASSPDGANIFAAVQEEVFLERDQLSNRQIAFYGRYIDDGFMIVYAPTSADALAYAQSVVKFHGLELTWEVSDRSLNFLDLMVYVDPVTMKLNWRPFRKARNNLERIPFASHHPIDIKRGTFLGEMSRMAVLSSSSANYLDALSDLARIYLARGYPFALVKKWIRENSAKRWANRFSEKSPSGVTGGSLSSKLLVLKSTFDPAWEEFNVHELEDIVVKQWVKEIAAIRTRWTTTWNSGDQVVVDAFFAGRNTQDDIAEWRTGNRETVNLTGAVREGEAADGMTERLWLKFWRKNRQGNGYTMDRYLDVSSVGLTDARWLVSRKKVRGLADILNKLKRDALDESSRLQELHSMAVETLPMDDIPEHSGINWFPDMDIDG